jgi:hypothetical protein
VEIWKSTAPNGLSATHQSFSLAQMQTLNILKSRGVHSIDGRPAKARAGASLTGAMARQVNGSKSLAPGPGSPVAKTRYKIAVNEHAPSVATH